ncbi:MAG: ROK family protein [Acidimicrobiaceae bacterium]|nr:ROK family protein [Acidimicrobiaceae bacterium]MYD07764.1 ROK family protein [Acidimicrobiaceae bacterium]MYI57310.1 ROK family protein [Acidimicrobiaceae bacterium]
MRGVIVGIDVGGTKALGLLVDPDDGRIVARTKKSSHGSGDELVARLTEIVADLSERSPEPLQRVGLGIAGLAARTGVVRYSPNLPNLVEFPVGQLLAETTQTDVITINDATAGTWAEAKLGAGRGTEDFAYVALGSGIGTGFVAGGHLLLGANGFAGESGHMTVDASGPAHITGEPGPWEYFASGNGLGRLGREAATAGDFPAVVALVSDINEIRSEHVITALNQGDPTAAEIFDGFCREAARGIANLILILDSSRVVIGGGLAEVGEPLRAGIDDWLQRLLLGSEHRPRVEVVLATFGSESGALGAALVAADPLGL